MTNCGSLTSGTFLKFRPERERLLEVLVKLTQKVSEIHIKGLVYLGLKGENVKVRDTHTHIIGLGLALVPCQCVSFKNMDLGQVKWICPKVARGSPITYS